MNPHQATRRLGGLEATDYWSLHKYFFGLQVLLLQEATHAYMVGQHSW